MSVLPFSEGSSAWSSGVEVVQTFLSVPWLGGNTTEDRQECLYHLFRLQTGMSVSLHISEFILQTSAAGLFAFDGFEEGAEVAFSETQRAATPLDDFEKECRPRKDALRKQLQ